MDTNNLDLLDYLKFGDSGEPLLDAPTQAIALTWVRSRCQTIAAWAAQFGQDSCHVRYPGGKHYEVPAQLAEVTMSLPLANIANQSVFTLAQSWSRESVNLLAKMVEEPSPQTLIRLTDQRQVWCNQPFAELMRQSGQEVIQKSIVNYWLPEDLNNLYQMLKTESNSFEINYRAQLNDDPNLWGNLTARNEIFQVDGQWYRLSTNLASQLIACPEPVH
ncbi:PAS domain-containing protein [Nostoc sp.]|uniref:PAS domain-containing protein n=1 Tax=Nostoc sp. TaxID=1180 RepID=UPI0035938989